MAKRRNKFKMCVTLGVATHEEMFARLYQHARSSGYKNNFAGYLKQILALAVAQDLDKKVRK